MIPILNLCSSKNFAYYLKHPIVQNDKELQLRILYGIVEVRNTGAWICIFQ